MDLREIGSLKVRNNITIAINIFRNHLMVVQHVCIVFNIFCRSAAAIVERSEIIAPEDPEWLVKYKQWREK